MNNKALAEFLKEHKGYICDWDLEKIQDGNILLVLRYGHITREGCFRIYGEKVRFLANAGRRYYADLLEKYFAKMGVKDEMA